MADSNFTVKYNDSELQEFKTVIEKKLTKFQKQLETLQTQILETTENSGDEHGVDWVDDSTFNNHMEMLNNMAIRQRKYIQDLKNALIRIENKTYGICVVTGKLIDKKRLMAVPTTTKSLEAKQDIQKQIDNKGRTVRTTRNATSSKPAKKVVKKKESPPKVQNLIEIVDSDEELVTDNADFEIEEEAVSRAKIDFDDLNSGSED